MQATDYKLYDKTNVGAGISTFICTKAVKHPLHIGSDR